MFKQNKYTRWYDSIVDYRRSSPYPEKDGERHHVVPKSIGGSNHKENLVYVSSREHFILHLLLTKMCVDPVHEIKMSWALHKLSFSNKRCTATQYELARKMHRRFLVENHHAHRIPNWNEKMRAIVTESWKGNDARRLSVSQSAKHKWATGKFKPKFGQDNGMYGKISPKRGKKYPNSGMKGIANPSSKIYQFKSPEGEILRIDCLTQFCIDNNLSYECMLKVANGKNKQHKKFTFIGKESRYDHRVNN